MEDIVATIEAPIIVGVGASAGGLEAFEFFLQGLPDYHNLIIVLVQHLDPDHESLMPELVSARTKSPVHSVTNNMHVTPGSIYLIPPGYEMEIEGTQLQLTEFAAPRGLRRPIDRFFKSLAKSHRDNAIGVILSGTGSDGAEGAREIKGAGGLVFVQDPSQAKYDGMPQSVIDLNCADAITPANEVIDLIRDYFHIRVGVAPDLLSDEMFIERVTRHIRFRTGHDFLEYKTGTILRRVALRMSVLSLTQPQDYLKYIAKNKEEADTLFQNLLINVTSFFRDEQHFDALQRGVISDLVERASESDEIRVWVAACSTGEEAYSIGIYLLEELARVRKTCKVVIFATDIDDMALHTARSGRYLDTIASSVPEEYLDRYFRVTARGYEIGPELREIVRFSHHSFIKDPPFSKLDLISCRNVLIYMKETLQELASRVFHYGLNEDGYLFLGSSENPACLKNNFQEISSRDRIFRRRPGPSHSLNMGAFSGVSTTRLPKAINKGPAPEKFSYLQLALQEHHLPAYMHLNHQLEVMFASSKATRFISVRPGVTRTGVFDFIVPELETVVRRMLRMTTKSEKIVEDQWQGHLNGKEERLIISVENLEDGTSVIVIQDRLLVLDHATPAREDGAEYSEDYVRDLEIELDDAKQELRTTVEELETSNEELKSSNEEMMSMNEELQSGNEELSTINDELTANVRQLNQVNRDLKNFEHSARIATVFLNEDLKLLNFTREAEQYFTFVDSDIGRALYDLEAAVNKDELLDLCKRAMTTQSELIEMFRTKDGRNTLRARIIPYSPRGMDTRGVVFTLTDVTELQDAIREAQELRVVSDERLQEVEQIYNNSPVAMGLFDRDARYVRVNQRLADIHGVALEAHFGRRIKDIIPDISDAAEEHLNKVFATGEPVRGVTIQGANRAKPDDIRTWQSDWEPYVVGDELVGVNLHVRDVTDEIETSERLQKVLRELEHRIKNMLANVTAIIDFSARQAKDDDIYTTLRNRILALSKTHALLTARQWTSAGLFEIIAAETIEIYGVDRVSLGGPEILMNSEATLALGMVFHEVATNAAKYGALSNLTGKVEIEWMQIKDARSDRIVITWRESGGPKIQAPDRSGLGTELIKTSIRGSLAGDYGVEWKPEGAEHRIELDIDMVCDLTKD